MKAVSTRSTAERRPIRPAELTVERIDLPRQLGADMTTRQILDRAFLRALNKDISLAGNWEPLDCLAGNESLIAQHIAMLVSGGVDEDKLGRILRRCLSIEDITEALNAEQLGHVNDTDTGSLFA